MHISVSCRGCTEKSVVFHFYVGLHFSHRVCTPLPLSVLCAFSLALVLQKELAFCVGVTLAKEVINIEVTRRVKSECVIRELDNNTLYMITYTGRTRLHFSRHRSTDVLSPHLSIVEHFSSYNGTSPSE